MSRVASSLNILSWNVASWPTTAAKIIKHHGSLTHWLDRHNVDILCLQEVKATKPKLLPCMPPHWDVFLAPCEARPGLNGVATFVRRNRLDFPTVGADAKPFGIPDLDNQGRCILTDHGAFTLINVYAPYDGELGVQLGLKLKFLDALVALVKRVQASGRAVICVGDFNVARFSKDVHYEFRRIDVDAVVSDFEKSVALCEAKIGKPLSNEVLDLLRFLRSEWPNLRETLVTRRKVSEINANGNATKFALRLGPKSLLVGQRQTSAKACDGIANPGTILTEDGFVYKPKGVLSVVDLFEVISKLCQRDFSEQARMAFSDVFAVPRVCPAVTERFDELTNTSKLIDTYVHANPAGRQLASERFTCWDQYRNDRYENKGARIDYILVDGGIVDSVRLVETEDHFKDPFKPLASGLSPLAVSGDRAKALSAATAENRWKAVPFAGGGIDNDVSLHAKTFEFTFTNPPQTGIVYTAPLYSDHVACSCVIDLAKLPTEGINERMRDELGLKWASAKADAFVAPAAPKSHSLKTMFSKAFEKREGVSAPASLPKEVIDLDDSNESVSCKKFKSSSQ